MPTKAVLAKAKTSVRFQADLTPKEAAMLDSLKEQLEIRSNADLLSNTLAMLSWLVRERREGRIVASFVEDHPVHQLVWPLLERVAPEYELPRVQIDWTSEELASFAKHASAEPATPTPALVRILARR